MFKDYYKILGVAQSSSISEIKSAYKTMSIKWHPDRNPSFKAKTVMQDINEAYAILNDEEKRHRYDVEYNIFKEQQYSCRVNYKSHSSSEADWNYDYEVHDETLKQDIHDASQLAKDLVEKFYASLKDSSNKAVHGAWDGAKGYVIVGLFFLLIAIFVRSCIQTEGLEADYVNIGADGSSDVNDSQTRPRIIEAFQVPLSWKKYYFCENSFSISVPNSVELRKDGDTYTRKLKQIDDGYEGLDVVFQPKGLSELSHNAAQHYCRILIKYVKANDGDFFKSDEAEPIDDNLRNVLRGMVEEELGPFILIGEPSYEWIDIGGINALKVEYRRTAINDYTTKCAIYLLFNDYEFVKMLISYREQERDLWLPDLNNVVKTFKWE